MKKGAEESRATVPGGGEPRQEAAFRTWDDERGFGWLELESGRLFGHIKDFSDPGRRPAVGERVSFVVREGRDGKKRAGDLRFVRAGGRIGSGVLVLLGCLLVLPVFAGLRLGWEWWVIPCWLAVMSAIAWCAYRSDKRKARTGGWRISETQLHLVELLGGWGGGLLAQRRFRHKTRKGSYQLVFWAIVLIYEAFSASVVFGFRNWDWLPEVKLEEFVKPGEREQREPVPKADDGFAREFESLLGRPLDRRE